MRNEEVITGKELWQMPTEEVLKRSFHLDETFTELDILAEKADTVLGALVNLYDFDMSECNENHAMTIRCNFQSICNLLYIVWDYIRKIEETLDSLRENQEAEV